MQQLIDIAKRSLKTLWVNKYLWFFGFFVAAAGQSGGGSGEGGAHHTYTGGVGAVPTWLWFVMGAALIVGLVFFVLHILSEAALIEGVADGQKGEKLGIRQGLSRSRRHFWKVIGLKVLLGLAAGLSVAVVAAPAILGHVGVLPLWLGITAAVLLGLAALPWLLTLYFIYMYALRFAVLEDYRTIDSIRQARRFLHGRIGLSIKLALLALVGNVGAGLAMVVAIIPGAVAAGIAYLIGGLVPAIVAGSLLALPLMSVVLGVKGTFQSSVWTLGFMDHHYAA